MDRLQRSRKRSLHCYGLVLGVITGVLLLPTSSFAEIYRYRDSSGQLHFSNQPFSKADKARASKNRSHDSQSLASAGLSTDIKIYKYVDASGVVHLTDRPPDGRYKMIYSGKSPVPTLPMSSSFAALPRSDFMKRTPTKQERAQAYADLIEAAATRNQLDTALLHAVIKAESSYNPDAVSPKGAVGLMQLMPGTASRYGVSDRYDPASNIDGGAQYLSDLLRLFDQNTRLAVAAYNAGENAVIKYGNQVPPYQETEHYVERVLSLYERYRDGS